MNIYRLDQSIIEREMYVYYRVFNVYTMCITHPNDSTVHRTQCIWLSVYDSVYMTQCIELSVYD